MARPREFDETAVLEAAMGCFWADGYEAASVRALAGQMGISGASLYNAFGDKRSLYLRALDHYLQQSVRERIERLERGLPPLAAVRAFFDEVIERSVSDPRHRGCMLMNAALEAAPHDGEIRAVVAAELQSIEAFFRRCIGATPAADGLAGLLLSTLIGIRVLARVRPERALLESAAGAALSALERGTGEDG